MNSCIVHSNAKARVDGGRKLPVQRLAAPLLGVVLACLAWSAWSSAQAAPSAVETYQWPKDPKVLANLKRWQDYKFGILIHEGLYSQLGIMESWPLCPEDWTERKGFDDYCSFAENYRAAKSAFNPVNIDPDKWARAFKDAGARYVIYTTKHHDGFCLFDTKTTDFKVTDKGCPFYANAKSNLVREVFNACRGQGLAIGAYFSKPDWTTTNFWWPYYPPKDRNPNYDTTKHPDRWRAFVNYTHEQFREIVSDYGPLDILWLDGCWLRPLNTINARVAEYCKYPHDLDIDMKTVAAVAREKQPGMLIVDRWVQGEFENYLTPEQNFPDKRLPVPFESCITLGDNWGWVPHDPIKSSSDVIQMMIKIVAKGGNLLLGIGPDGKGEFEPEVYQRLSEIGQWMRANGDAIYGSTPVAPYQEGKVAYTAQGKDTVYAFYLPEKNEKQWPPELTIKTMLRGPLEVSLPAQGQKLASSRHGGGVKVLIPESLRSRAAGDPALVIRVQRAAATR